MKIQIIINQQRITLNYLKMKKNNINHIYLFQLFMIVLLIILGTSKLNAQLKVGNNPKTLNPNSLFEMESTNKGMLMPRLALVHPDSFTPMTAHIKGMIVFNTDSTINVTPGMYYNTGLKWIKLLPQITALNGLALVNNNIILGGWLTQPTIIGGLNDINKMEFNGFGNNMFNINTTAFSVNGSQNNVGMGTSVPSNSAVLELSSTFRGFLPPRMTNSEFKAIANPVNGLTIFNTSANCLMYYTDGTYNCSYVIPPISAPIAPIGSTYTSHYNGISSGVNINYLLSTYSTGETFNNNISCQGKPISAQGCGALTQVTGKLGNIYPLININGQCWMQTNLKEIPKNFALYKNNSWLTSSPNDQGYWGFFNTAYTNGAAGWGILEPVVNEGYLYQWSAAMDNSINERAQGVCPAGFHIPSDCEWKYLEHGQGMAISEQNIQNAWRSTTTDNQGTPGNKLRSQGTGQTNASGFSGLLAGYRGNGGTFVSRGSSTIWWTSTSVNSSNIICRNMATNLKGVSSYVFSNDNAFSVRCLKD